MRFWELFVPLGKAGIEKKKNICIFNKKKSSTGETTKTKTTTTTKKKPMSKKKNNNNDKKKKKKKKKKQSHPPALKLPRNQTPSKYSKNWFGSRFVPCSFLYSSPYAPLIGSIYQKRP